MTRIFGIVPAAGSGTRMNSQVPKILLPIRDEPAVARTLRLLGEQVKFEFVAVAASATDIEAVADAIHTIDIPHAVIPGGAARQDSVALALQEISRRCKPSPDDLVLIHDAARCFVSPALVSRCIEGAHRTGAVTAAIPVVDTLVRADSESRITGQIDRAGAWAVQTPQVFRFDLIERAHAGAVSGATDDASLVAAFHPVTVVQGDRENLKLTTPADYKFAVEYLI